LERNEYGEIEFVLGSKQLLGIFVIIVILLGAFFSIGYIFGRNSTPAAVDARNTTPPKPIVVPKPTDQDTATSQPPTPAVEENKEAANASKPAPTIPIPPPVSKPAPVADESKPKPSPLAKDAPPKPAPKPAEKAADSSPRLAISEPPAGQYWQVMAAERADAELIAGELSKKGLKSLLAPAPKDGYYRVLVGPFENPARMAEIRTDLEKAGFKSPIVRKY